MRQRQMGLWILLEYSVGLRAAPGPLRRPLTFEDETVKRVKKKRRAVGAQRRAEGETHRGLSRRPEHINAPSHPRHLVRKVWAVHFDVTPETNLKHSWFTTRGRSDRSFTTFKPDKTGFSTGLSRVNTPDTSWPELDHIWISPETAQTRPSRSPAETSRLGPLV